MHSVCGFEGCLFSGQLIKDNFLCLGTDCGLFIYDTERSYSEPDFKILFDNSYSCKSFGYNCMSNELFILNNTGEVRTTTLRSHVSTNIEEMEIFRKSGCSSIFYHEKSSSYILTDVHGIWINEGEKWNFAFKVLVI